MQTIISNNILQISVKHHGAELSSLIRKRDGAELLWQGDPEYWTGQSPVLFPIVGNVPEDIYSFSGNTYPLGRHGFARRSDFELEINSESQLRFVLRSNEKSKAVYPFDFALFETFTLKNNLLEVDFEVQNTGKEPLYFSIGAHPAFKCPMNPDGFMSDYHLEFERNENLNRRMQGDPLLTGEQVPFLRNSNVIPLSHELFYDNAVILQEVKSNWIDLIQDDGETSVPIIRLHAKGFPYLGIWAPVNDAPFVCIEPWYGVASTVGDSDDLPSKEGIMKLAPGAAFTCTYGIEVL
ncbi:MAG: aldose 1-epimerase family protein [Bacteroidetes bacterium]|nr:aldose 1-epimerase family protein [Bacteroidota bacterium]